MKTREAIDLYKAYTSVKFTGVPTADRLVMLRNMRLLRPISDEYDAMQMNASEKFKPEGYDELEQEVMSHAGDTVTPELNRKRRPPGRRARHHHHPHHLRRLRQAGREQQRGRYEPTVCDF